MNNDKQIKTFKIIFIISLTLLLAFLIFNITFSNSKLQFITESKHYANELEKQELFKNDYTVDIFNYDDNTLAIFVVIYDTEVEELISNDESRSKAVDFISEEFKNFEFKDKRFRDAKIRIYISSSGIEENGKIELMSEKWVYNYKLK